MKLVVKYDTNMFTPRAQDSDLYDIKISSKPNNGVELDPSTHQLKFHKGPAGRSGVGGTMNLPGNGIAGTSGQGIKTIRCNSTVTRLESNDPAQLDGGKNIWDIINNILEGVTNP